MSSISPTRHSLRAPSRSSEPGLVRAGFVTDGVRSHHLDEGRSCWISPFRFPKAKSCFIPAGMSAKRCRHNDVRYCFLVCRSVLFMSCSVERRSPVLSDRASIVRSSSADHGRPFLSKRFWSFMFWYVCSFRIRRHRRKCFAHGCSGMENNSRVLMNATGRTVVTRSKGNKQVRMDLHGLKAGAYVVSVTGARGERATRVMQVQ